MAYTPDATNLLEPTTGRPAGSAAAEFRAIKAAIAAFTGVGLFVMPQQYGAVGDGLVDDTAALNTMFAAVINNGGGRIYFPKGTYKCSSSIGYMTTTYTGVVDLDLIGESGSIIDVNPTAQSNYAIYLQIPALRRFIARDLRIKCNTKVASGLWVRSTGSNPIDSAIIDNVIVQDCHAVNDASITVAPTGIFVDSANGVVAGEGNVASVTNCSVINVTKSKNLAASGIILQGFKVNVIDNNYIKNIRHDGVNLQDADGIKVFNAVAAAIYERGATSVRNNTLIDCEGRFVKLQTGGAALVSGNTMRIDGVLTLIQDWHAVDSQVMDADIVNNYLFMGSAWTGGASAIAMSLQAPTALRETYEASFHRCCGNKMYTDGTYLLAFASFEPNKAVNGVFHFDISDNLIHRDGVLTDATQTPYAATNFVYANFGVSAPTGSTVLRVSRNSVYTYHFIQMAGSGAAAADHDTKLWLYVHDNQKFPSGYEREVFYLGATTPYSSRIMVRDNNIGGGDGQVTFPFDFAKILDGCNFYTGGSTLVNGPGAGYSFSNVGKCGNYWFVDRGWQGRFSTSDPTDHWAGTPALGRTGVEIRGDVAPTLTAGASKECQYWNSPLTVDRAVTLSTTGAKEGATFRIVRSANATGAFNLNVGTGPLKALNAAGQWCEVTYNGSAWILTAYGTL